VAAPRASKLRNRIKSARRVSDQAQRTFLLSEDVHSGLSDREARRAERERSTPDDSAERFPQVTRRRST
jgi:hypothetical protein